MAKTDMTKQIEQAILAWHPKKIGDIQINPLRRENTALEVVAKHGSTTGGIVDAVRVSEYFGDIEMRRICRLNALNADARKRIADAGSAECDPTHARSAYCERTECRWNGICQCGVEKIAITCFEIKVTVRDFQSAHGHNFVGNMNYYVVPEEIYRDVEPAIPDDIGILVYLHLGNYVGLRTRRKSAYREITDEDQKWLLLSVMNRTRDMDRKRYYNQIDELRKHGGYTDDRNFIDL